jgi:predicted AAA+ superfamily ATPase
MLEKAFVVFRLPCFQLNKKNELKKSRKIYFTDNGIRNAIINQWGEIELRSDAGALWENWIMSERHKLIRNEQAKTEMYFWRTIAQQEVDLVEVKDKNLPFSVSEKCELCEHCEHKRWQSKNFCTNTP